MAHTPRGTTRTLLAGVALLAAATASAIGMAPLGAVAAARTTDPRQLTSISCPTTTFCLAGDAQGNVVIKTGTSWGTIHHLSDAPLEVTCSSADFCVAMVESGEAFIYNGSSWTSGTSVEGGATMTSLACTGPKFCLALDNFGGYYTYDGTSWSDESVWDSAAEDDPGLAGVSCVSSTWCEAVDQAGDGGTFNGTGWSIQSHIDTDQVNTISCTAKNACVAVDAGGRALDLTSIGWSTPLAVDSNGGPFPISCWSASDCVLVDSSGGAAYSTSTGWGAVSSVDSGHLLNSVSCTSSGACVAVDSVGVALSETGEGSWTSRAIDDNPYATSTTLHSSLPHLTYGDEGAGKFQLAVSSVFPDEVSGVVEVERGSQKVCGANLVSQKADCEVQAKTLPAGHDTVEGLYEGSTDFAPSHTTLVVVVDKDPTTATLTLSTSHVTVGHEESELLSVVVKPSISATVSGSVDVMAGTTRVCAIALSAGHGSCHLTASQLESGSYSLVAKYAGSSNVGGSTSAAHNLTVSG